MAYHVVQPATGVYSALNQTRADDGQPETEIVVASLGDVPLDRESDVYDEDGERCARVRRKRGALRLMGADGEEIEMDDDRLSALREDEDERRRESARASR